MPVSSVVFYEGKYTNFDDYHNIFSSTFIIIGKEIIPINDRFKLYGISISFQLPIEIKLLNDRFELSDISISFRLPMEMKLIFFMYPPNW